MSARALPKSEQIALRSERMCKIECDRARRAENVRLARMGRALAAAGLSETELAGLLAYVRARAEADPALRSAGAASGNGGRCEALLRRRPEVEAEFLLEVHAPEREPRVGWVLRAPLAALLAIGDRLGLDVLPRPSQHRAETTRAGDDSALRVLGSAPR